MFPKSLFDREAVSSPSKGPKSPPQFAEAEMKGNDSRLQGSFFSQLVRNTSRSSLTKDRDVISSPSFHPLPSSAAEGKAVGLGGRRSPAPLKEADLVALSGSVSPTSSPRAAAEQKKTPNISRKDKATDFVNKGKSKDDRLQDDTDAEKKLKPKKTNRSRSPPHKSQLIERKASNSVVDGLDLHVSTSSSSPTHREKKSPQRIFFKIGNPSASNASLRTNSSYFSEDPTQCSEFLSSSESSEDDWNDETFDKFESFGTLEKGTKLPFVGEMEQIEIPILDFGDGRERKQTDLKERIRERRKRRQAKENSKKAESVTSSETQESHINRTISSSCGSQNEDLVTPSSSAHTSDCSAEMNDNIDSICKSSSAIPLSLSIAHANSPGREGMGPPDHGQPEGLRLDTHKSLDHHQIEKRSPAKKPASLTTIARPIPKGNNAWKKESDTSSDGKRRTQRDISVITETMNPLFAIGRESEMGRFGQILVSSDGKGTLESVSLWIIQFLKGYHDPQWKDFMMILVIYHRRFMPTDLLTQILDHVSCNLFEETSINAIYALLTSLLNDKMIECDSGAFGKLQELFFKLGPPPKQLLTSSSYKSPPLLSLDSSKPRSMSFISKLRSPASCPAIPEGMGGTALMFSNEPTKAANTDRPSWRGGLGSGEKGEELGSGGAIEANTCPMPMSIGDLAATLTQELFEKYAMISLYEFYECAWTKSKGEAPYLSFISASFQEIVNWTAYHLLLAAKQNNFGKIWTFMIRFACKLKALRNILGCVAVVTGCTGHAVSRIQKLFIKEMTTKSMVRLEELQTLANPNENYLTYRDYLKRGISKTIPYIPVHLRDILYLEDLPEIITQIKDGKNVVNFEKYYKLFTAQQYVLSFRDKPPIHLPKIRVTDECSVYVRQCVLVTRSEEVLYEMSYSIKPTAT